VKNVLLCVFFSSVGLIFTLPIAETPISSDGLFLITCFCMNPNDPPAVMGIRKLVQSSGKPPKMNKKWYVLVHDSKYHKSLVDLLEGLGITVYCPKRITFKARRDRPSLAKYEVVLFPGYLLLYFDVEEIHTSNLTAFNGAYGFVRFGDNPPCVINEADIEKMRSALEMHSLRLENKGLEQFNSESFERTFQFIVDESSAPARCAYFHELLKQNDITSSIGKKS
jgi:transcriptional antiterminator RfaH